MHNHYRNLAGFADPGTGGSKEELLELAFPLAGHYDHHCSNFQGFFTDAVANTVRILSTLQMTATSNLLMINRPFLMILNHCKWLTRTLLKSRNFGSTRKAEYTVAMLALDALVALSLPMLS